MTRSHRHSQQAGVLLLALITITSLAFIAVFTLHRVSPRFRMAAQAGAWQEARLSAEAGIDLALGDLETNATGFQDGPWTGWQTSNPMAAPSANSGLLSPVLNLVGNTLAPVTNPVAQLLSSTVSQVNNSLSVLGNSVKVSAPVFRTNVQAAAAGNRPTNVDLQLWAVYPTASPYYRWFRLRAMATCVLPPVATTVPDTLDVPLRRYSLHNVRPQLLHDGVSNAASLPAPSTSRIIEVLVEPVLPFELALFTKQSLSLGTNGTWAVDSYDSRDPSKSAPGGLYPGSNSPLTQSNGNIASNAARPGDSLYGPLIAANGTLVRGGVATNGGDNPETTALENISGAGRIDTSRVRDDFYRDMNPIARPSSGIFLPPPLPGQPFMAESASSQPSQYLISKNLSAFSVAGPADGSAGAVIIMVNGDLDIPTGTISIPANVTVQIFVEGNVDFHQNSINANRPPAQLQIYGEDSHGEKRTLRAFGSAAINAAFYGPDYDVNLNGSVDWSGSVAANSFQMLGGGNGGFHYDEALGMVGGPISFRIARYVEDVRE